MQQGDDVMFEHPSFAADRHPQYFGFIVILVGFLLQWPTLLTLLMFPVLVVMYVRLAQHEEREAAAHFSEAWRAYAAVTPAWLPRLGTRSPREVGNGSA